METALREEINIVLNTLPEKNVRALLKTLRRLGARGRIRRWSAAVGSLSDTEAEEMRRIIEEECDCQPSVPS